MTSSLDDVTASLSNPTSPFEMGADFSADLKDLGLDSAALLRLLNGDPLG